MNQINLFVQQLRSLFAGMTPQARLLAVLLTAGVAISSVFLVQGATSGNGNMTYLFDGRTLDESQLTRIEIALSNAALRGYERQGNRIRIPSSTKDTYYKAISEGKAVPEGMGGALEAAVNGNSFLESSQISEAKMRAGRLRDCSNTIKQMDPLIVDAFVTYDEKREGFSGQRRQTASIAVKTLGNKPLSIEKRQGIITFVEKTFAGLKRSDIVLLSSSETTTNSDDPSAIAEAKYYQIKRQREEDLRRRAEDMLSNYGNVKIDVNVEIDPTISEKLETLGFDKPASIQTMTTKKDSKMQRMEVGGRPGTEPNALGKANERASLSTIPDQSSETKEEMENDKKVIGNTLTQIERAGLQTKHVTFSVSVPFSYYPKASLHKWQKLNPEKKPTEYTAFSEAEFQTIKTETETSIQKKLTAILPKGAAGEDTLPKVSVDYYYDMPEKELPTPSLSQNAMVWLAQSWQSIALMGLVGAALVSLRSFAKTTPSSNDGDFERGFDLPLDDASDIDLNSLTDEESDSFAEKTDAEPQAPRLRTTGGDVKSDLTAMVRENPDAAATLLRNWIAGT